MACAVVLKTIGGPEMLELADIAIQEPKPTEVQIRQSVAGVNFVDIYHRIGLYPLPPAPAVLGVEGAGVVVSIGSMVTRFKPGDRVAYAGFPLGGYAEVRVVPESRLVLLPDDISDRVAGSTMLRGLTAHMLLFKVHPVKKGDWILMHASAGGLGQLVTRWARRLGARVIGTVGSEAKIALARAAGAEEVVLHTDPAWGDEVRRITDGKGVHLAIDGIGGAMLSQTLGVVRPFGIAASLGQPAGPIPPVKVEELGFQRSILLGRPSALGYANDPALYQRGAQDLIAALQAGLMNPIGAEYPLAKVAQAHADLEAGRTTGSVILTI